MAKLPQAFDRVTSLHYQLSFLAALTPAAASAVALQGWRAGLLLGLAVLSAWGTEELVRLLRSDRGPRDWSAPLTGLLLGLLLPTNAPWALAVVGPLFAVGVVRGLLGGGATPWLNPVLAGWAFLQAGWPGAFAGLPAVGSGGRTPFDQQGIDWLNTNVFSWLSVQVPSGYLDWVAGLARPETAILAESGCFWLLAATVYLLARGFVPWEVPAAYFAAFIVPTVLAGSDALGQVFGGALLLNLFFLASDPSGRPLGRPALLVYAAGAGLLSFLVRTWGLGPDGVGYAVLLMNLLVPWIDQTWRRKSLNDFRVA